MAQTKAVLQARLNKASPNDKAVKTGDVLNDIITNFNAMLEKLDADAGVTDTNYASTLAVKALNKRQ